MTDPLVRPVQNPDGSPNIEVRGRLLHSKQNPLEEARRFLEPLLRSLPESETLVILGFGAGYAARALFELKPAWLERPYFSGKALFVENEPWIFSHALALLPAEVRAHVRLLPDISEVPGHVSGKIALVSLPAHKALFPELHRTGVDDSTRHRFFRLWAANALRRAESSQIYIQPSDSPHKALLFCGAGPGLFAHKEAILEAELLAAADTALAPLLHEGIVPDIVLSIDAGGGTHYHLEAARQAARSLEVKLSEIPVFTWSGAHAALETYFSTVWLYRTTFPLDQILGRGPLASIPEQINESRNTAGLALILASLLGIRTAAAAGTGYVSSGTVTHVPGTGYDLYARLRQSRLTPAAGYRPGSYRAELTGKHRLSALGLLQMARRLSVELADPDSLHREAGVEISREPGRGQSPRLLRAQKKVQPLLFPCEPACESFLGNWALVAGQLGAFGLSPRDIARRHARLAECKAAKPL